MNAIQTIAINIASDLLSAWIKSCLAPVLPQLHQQLMHGVEPLLRAIPPPSSGEVCYRCMPRPRSCFLAWRCAIACAIFCLRSASWCACTRWCSSGWASLSRA